jgi:2-oxoglutarate dehydrogenase E2 component (dihydrolipoamide succinyltransferase)
MSAKIVVPELGESVLDATVRAWLKREGERVSVGEPLVELETDKVDLEVGAPQEGILARIEVEEGQDVRVGDVLGIIEGSPEKGDGPAPQPSEEDASFAEDQGIDIEHEIEEQLGEDSKDEVSEKERISPVARRLAQEKGIDVNEIASTSPGKRITKEDVERHIQQQTKEKDGKPESQEKVDEPATTKGERREEIIQLSRRRRTIARRLVEAQQTTAMLTTFNDVDMSVVIDLRQKKRDEFQQRHNVKLGFMSFFVKASIAALKAFPHFNAEIRGDDNQELVLKYYYDIGIAIGAEDGLVVPVLRNADQMMFADIEKKILEFVQKTEDKSLAIEDLQGGTFSITNGGVFGSLLSTPILNPPQMAILGMHRIEQRPVAIDGQVVIRPMMYLALSYDHRVVDGRQAVLFLNRIKELIEDPANLLFEY